MTRDERNAQRISELHPDVQPLARDLIATAKAELGKDIYVTFGRRTFEQQEALWAQGRRPLDEVNALRFKAGMAAISQSENQKRVTKVQAGESMHEYGRAIDVAFHWDKDGDGKVDDGEIGWDGPWLALGEIGEKLGFRWLGRIRSNTFPDGDKPHFEYGGGFTMAELREAYLTARASKRQA